MLVILICGLISCGLNWLLTSFPINAGMVNPKRKVKLKRTKFLKA